MVKMEILNDALDQYNNNLDDDQEIMTRRVSILEI
jgi:hypothetical protein